MAVVSQYVAARIARAEAEKKFDKQIEKEEEKLINLLEKLVVSEFKVPNEIKKITEGENANWINTNSSVRVRELVTGSEYFNLNSSFPCLPKNCTFEVKACEKTKEVYKSINKLRDEKSKFKSKLESTILALKTDKKVIENIPELKNHFESVNSLLPVAMSDIKLLREGIVRP